MNIEWTCESLITLCLLSHFTWQKMYSLVYFQCCRILDNLPLVVPLRRPDRESSLVYLHGFLVGLKGQYAGVSASLMTLFLSLVCVLFWQFKQKCWQNKDEKHFVHNHLTFVVKYHRDPVTETSRIVGFEVKPFRLCIISLSFLVLSIVWFEKTNFLSFHFLFSRVYTLEKLKTTDNKESLLLFLTQPFETRNKICVFLTKSLVNNSYKLKLLLWIQCKAWIWRWVG